MMSLQSHRHYKFSKHRFASVFGRENIVLGVSMTVSMMIMASVLGSSP